MFIRTNVHLDQCSCGLMFIRTSVHPDQCSPGPMFIRTNVHLDCFHCFCARTRPYICDRPSSSILYVTPCLSWGIATGCLPEMRIHFTWCLVKLSTNEFDRYGCKLYDRLTGYFEFFTFVGLLEWNIMAINQFWFDRTCFGVTEIRVSCFLFNSILQSNLMLISKVYNAEDDCLLGCCVV
jgi:hypothetical protein